ncbi:hypothetical protein HQ545_00165 [Candidatus Woesearchaeota archaeon]|nr:hypothetical protein [Candidatus Woesearchaeota archaeon]
MKKGVKKRVSSRLTDAELDRAIKEAQNDPKFISDVNKFIKATTRVYKL